MSINNYLDLIGREPLLTASEELELSRLIQAGQAPEATKLEQRRGLKAKNRMVLGNLRLAVNIAKKFHSRTHHLKLEDLTQEAVFGLIRAAEKFDPQLGYKFSTYAYWWIKQSVMRAIVMMEQNIRTPIHVREMYDRYRRVQEKALAETGKYLSLSEAASLAKASVEMLEMNARAASCGSLNIIYDSDKELINLIATEIPDQGFMSELGLDRKQLNEAFLKLPSDSAEVLRRNYGLDTGVPEALTSIASSMKLSKDRTTKAHRLGKALLREHLHRKKVHP